MQPSFVVIAGGSFRWAGQGTARTHARLAVITADIPCGLAPLRPAPARASAPAAARDRAIMATAILTGLAFAVSPDAGPGPSVAGALAVLLFVGGTGSAFVSLFLLGIRMRSQRTQHPGSQLPPPWRRVDSGTSAAHKAISATSAERLPRAAKPRRGTTDAAKRHSLRPQLSS